MYLQNKDENTSEVWIGVPFQGQVTFIFASFPYSLLRASFNIATSGVSAPVGPSSGPVVKQKI